MAFTGVFGTSDSQLGNIVLGSLPGFGAQVDTVVHQIRKNVIRVVFPFSIEQGGDVFTSYSLSTSSLSAFVPSVTKAEYETSSQKSVLLTLSGNLTQGETYTVNISGVLLSIGTTINNLSKNFVANVYSPPLALGAFQSKNQSIDVIFDKPVGPYSGSAVFTLREPGGSFFPLTQLNWASEGIPENTLRLQYGLGIPTGESYEVTYVDVFDESNNQGGGEVPLTLALRSDAPYDFSKLTQLQFTDAYVVNVVADWTTPFAVIRTFFNMPVENVLLASVTFDALAPHRQTDTINSYLLPDPTPGTLPAFANGLKASINSHYDEASVHFQRSPRITTPDASNNLEAITLINSCAISYLKHIDSKSSHSYSDVFNDFSYTPAFDDTTAIALAIELRTNFNDHLLEFYPLSEFNSPPPPLQTRSSFALLNTPDNAFDVENEYTYFAEFLVEMKSVDAPIRIIGDFSSEIFPSTTQSFTNPLDFTGNITARPLSDEPKILGSNQNGLDNVSIFFDKEIIKPSGNQIKISNERNTISDVPTPITSYRSLILATNHLIFTYNEHLTRAIHRNNDSLNVVSVSSVLPISNIFAVLNEIKNKYNSHIVSNFYHFNSDNDIIKSTEAVDIFTAGVLIKELRTKIGRHVVNTSYHSSPSFCLMTAPLFDSIYFEVSDILNGSFHEISGDIRYEYTLNSPDFCKQEFKRDTSLMSEFFGLAENPSIASVVPVSGLQIINDQLSFRNDFIQVWFSKPMNEIEIDDPKITLTGGSIVPGERRWTSSSVLAISVENMESIQYNIDIVDVFDEAGNSIV